MTAIAAASRDYEPQPGMRSGYDDWFEAGLNNAHLASVATYFDCVPGFERLLARTTAICRTTMARCARWHVVRRRSAATVRATGR